MCKIDCKRGYKRYMDFNHNRLILLVKEWYSGKLMIDFYYNDQFISYIKTEASWTDLFNSDSSDLLVIGLVQDDDKLKKYLDVFRSMKLSEENLLFYDDKHQLELYVTAPFRQKASLKICRALDVKEKKVLQCCSLDAYVYEEIYNECIKYLDGLDAVADNLVKLYECQNNENTMFR